MIALMCDAVSWLQVTPPGMNMVYLPYSDDVRQPEADTSFTGHAHLQADKPQIEAAEKLMAALSLPEFASSNIPNPTLQRHYQVKNVLVQITP